MNIPTHAVSRNPDLQSAFDSPDRIRMACPLCRDAGGDTNGDHLAIGGGRVHCFSDPGHGKELWLELREIEPNIWKRRSKRVRQDRTVQPADPGIPDGDPNAADFQNGSAFNSNDAGGGGSLKTSPPSGGVLPPGEQLRWELDVLLVSSHGDDDGPASDPTDGLIRVMRKARAHYFDAVADALEFTHVLGRSLNRLKETHDHGTWTAFIDEHDIDERMDRRARQVATLPWDEVEENNLRSVTAVTTYLRKQKGVQVKPVNKDKALIASLEAEKESMKASVTEAELMRAEIAELKKQVARKDDIIEHLRAERDEYRDNLEMARGTIDLFQTGRPAGLDKGHNYNELTEAVNGAAPRGHAGAVSFGDYQAEHNAGSQYPDD